MFDFGIFQYSEAWLSLVMLTFMEVVLGIDNIIFISLIASRLPEADRPKARNIGLALALVLRIVLLFGITLVQQMKEPFANFEIFGTHIGINGQGIILLAGGIFLVYKAVTEIHHKLEGDPEEFENDDEHIKISNWMQGVIQIAMLNIVFSFDSILTAIGMTNDLQHLGNPTSVMMVAVILSIAIMMAFSGPVGRFINNHPTIQMLGLSFLILIGFLLLGEGVHNFNHDLIGEIPKTYLYVVIIFSLAVEFLNMKLRKPHKVVQLRGVTQEATEDGVL